MAVAWDWRRLQAIAIVGNPNISTAPNVAPCIAQQSLSGKALDYSQFSNRATNDAWASFVIQTVPDKKTCDEDFVNVNNCVEQTQDLLE